MIYCLSKTKNPTLQMFIIGAKNTVAEMLIISTITNALRESGINDFYIKINSIGDQSSKEKYEKELKAFFRKHKKILPPYAQKEIAEKRYIKALKLLLKKDPSYVASAPSPLELLNDEGRTHLRNILEFLDFSDIEYELTPLLVGETEMWKHTLFEIVARKKTEEQVVARGGRYTTLVQKLTKKEIETTGAIVYLSSLGRVGIPKKADSKIFLSYTGDLARIKAVKLLESFFKEGIPVVNSFVHHSFLEQMKKVTPDMIDNVIIIGHKEALDDVVIVRNLHTNKQEEVPFDKVLSYIKKLNT